MKVELVSISEDPERLIELCARVSYRSYERITPESHIDFIRKRIQMGDESVLEHATATFRISGVSRALTHQLVRHRLASYTQESQRVVDQGEFGYVIPHTISAHKEAKEIFEETMKQIRSNYKRLREMGIPKEDARYILPNAVSTEIFVTANLREWRHILKMRLEKSAQWEIRELSQRILRILKREAPTVFEDINA